MNFLHKVDGRISQTSSRYVNYHEFTYFWYLEDQILVAFISLLWKAKRQQNVVFSIRQLELFDASGMWHFRCFSTFHPPMTSIEQNYTYIQGERWSTAKISGHFFYTFFLVSFLVWAIEGHFCVYISEIGPKKGAFQNFWNIFKPFFSWN